MDNSQVAETGADGLSSRPDLKKTSPAYRIRTGCLSLIGTQRKEPMAMASPS